MCGRRLDSQMLMEDQLCALDGTHPLGRIKWNIDRAMYMGQTRSRAGMVLRDERGALVAYRMEARTSRPTPRECEALAMEKALMWLRDRGCTNVIVELDALML
ncbi:hypothetical protein LINPERHAP1_LOCUS17481 [Linum perenne]